MASVGINGKGSSDSGDAGRFGEMVAICDVDTKFLDGAKKRFPKAKVYTDFRKMLDEMEKQIDAVTVSTPDHTHAVASLMAMRRGKHCFCQKPMTHSIWEAREMAKVARDKKVATEMGNQGTAGRRLREAAKLIRAGALGKLKEVHVWTNRPIWAQGGERPAPADCPENLEWDLWISRAPFRPYAPGYHPFSWRGWWDFGTGALGDMACHTLNMPFAGLDLRDPVSVQAETSGHNKDSYPKWSKITYQFPANDWRQAVTLYWYDGGQMPSPDVFPKLEDLKESYQDKRKKNGDRSGSLVVGEKGVIISLDDYCGDFQMIGGNPDTPIEVETSPGHFQEWVRAIKEGKPAMSNFPDYAGPLTETVLLGNLAVWVADKPGLGEKVQWDARAMKSTNISGLEKIVKPEPRPPSSYNM